MADAPENSLEAFRLALSKGCRGIESDVWLDPAGDPVLHHGPPHKEKRTPVALRELFAACGTDFDLSLDMSPQQQPTHHAPCSTPIRSAPDRPSRQLVRMNDSGPRHRMRHARFRGVASYTAAARSTPTASA